MTARLPAVAALCATLCAALALLPGCTAIVKPDAATLHDLGPLRTQQSVPLPALKPVSIAEIRVPVWLDSNFIYYRLNYANGQQPRPYAQARWTMPPPQLFMQHLKARIAQTGGVALSASDGAVDVPVLRIEMDEFTQNFDAPERSSGTVGLRATLFRGRTLVAQKSIVRKAPAPSADAAGGARALAAASDAAIADIMLWIDALK
ncbi:MAG TPA: ABC-type transport auxiliary lipoprotein family protein [Noviherbaspirillum sp.]|uniref:ABC-type transport auxiliary lipoprotein family protein n=1 Tax=Noviherbaspirillum sp. TaxID=1926288 RepID=UPI002D26675B|nr:ABC-type transport auxiliary lipoprotein family protein [Noviherbaspirillum sp.]HYD97464.1 ABC-type transport auxiliary lipoprotein family protein [Noviherbaspirillum sp.]